MDNIAALREILVSALGSGTVQDGEQALFDELIVSKPRLVKVFDFGGRSPQEQRQLESGKIEIEGRSLAVNKDFARQVTFLAQQLNCSERFLASVAHAVLADNPTIGEVDAIEQSVLAYHKLRRELADCLRFVFEAADAAEKGYAMSLHVRLKDFAKRQLLGSGAEGTLAYHILMEINSLNGVIANARMAVTNAVSNTTVPSTQGGSGNLGYAVLQARLESLLYERRTLAVALYFISRSGYLQPSELRLLLEWLQKNPRDDMTIYLLSALCAALDLSHSAPGTPSAMHRMAITREAATLSAIRKLLAPSTEWTDIALKATVTLKWTLFLTEARFRDQALECTEGFRNEDLEMQVFNAVQSDALTFMLSAVSLLNTKQSGATQLLASKISPSTVIDLSQLKASLADEFKQHFLHEFELIIRSLLTHAPAELRKIKHKQEDQFRPRSDRLRTSARPNDNTAEQPPPRNDIATLFLLIGQLYSALPANSAIQFWGGVPETETPAYYEMAEAERGKLPSFLRWAVEVREPELVISVFYMLAGLATGVACAECAYNFMATGTLDVIHGAGANVGRYESSAAFTWASIFSELDGWAALGSANPRGGAPHHGHGHGLPGSTSAAAAAGAPPPQLPLAQTDVLLGLAFLRLLTVIATHSVQARIAVASHPQYRAIACFIALIPLGVPLELKGALFEALAAFCLPGAGIAGVDVCRAVWTQMERLEVISVRSPLALGGVHGVALGTGSGVGVKGVEVELEEVESVYRVYPATIPFLELLATLMHTPKRVPLKSRVTEPEPLNTVPDGLGAPYRAPGIAPFVSFAVESVLGRLAHREFAYSNDKWRMADTALCFLERCLASFDLEALPGLAEEYALKGPEVLTPLLQHAGFDVLARILGETPLRATLIAYVIEGAEELGRQPGNAQFAKVVLRALRILERVLEIQDLFLDHLVPVLSEFDSSAIIGAKISQSFLSRIDQGLSLDHRSIPAISSFINQQLYPELMYLSTRILTALSQSPSFDNIATLIERSSESTVIVDGFVRALVSDSFEDVAEAEEWADLWTGAGAPDFEGEQTPFFQVIRLAVLDLLLRGTRSNSKSSSLAFLLLFGKTIPDAQIQDPHQQDSREYCIHVALFLLNNGVPRLSGKGKEKERRRADKAIPLFDAQPVLAERLYKLVYQLCEHPRTSSPMMLYLRTREDFFARHLAAMSMHVPGDPRAPVVEVLYGDGSRVATTCGTAKAFLQLRSWLLDLVSLELHVLTNKGQNQRIKELLDLLFGTTEYYEAEGADDWEHGVFRAFNDVGQSRIRAIELFQSLSFEWFDTVEVVPIELQFYQSLNLQACVRVDSDGCAVVDRAALFELLSSARRVLLRQGQIATAAHTAQLDAETRYVLESCVAENNRREVSFALGVAFESWKRLLDVVLTKCFTRIAQDQRENVLFDLLHVVPPAIHSPTLQESSAELLAGLLLLLITKLREERRQASLLSTNDSPAAGAIPQERMLALLRHMLDTIIDKHRGDRVRGNVYAALTSFLHLVSNSSAEEPTISSATSEASFSNLSTSLSLSNDDLRRSQKSSSLEASCSAVIKQTADRLIAVISKDAIDGAEVWKSVAFTLLEFLARLSSREGPGSRQNYLLSALDRYGLLSNVVHSIREADSALQDVLRPDPDDLNSLYVYETKMAFLGRLSQTRTGAERLLECRVLPILAQADFLDAQPEVDDAYFNQDGFLPSSLGRYHQLLVPALQLVGSLYASLGSRHTVASKQVLDFLYSHRDSFVIMLKQDLSPLTLSMIEELELIVSLCVLIVPSVPQTDFFATNTGFGGLHNAILALSAKLLGNSKWQSSVQPSDETEVRDAETPVGAYGANESKFEAKVRQTAFKFRRSVLAYLSAASNFSETELIIVLSPVVSSRQDERPSGVSVPLPTIKDVLGTLKSFSSDLLGVMQEIADINVELEYSDRVRVDNIEELLGPIESNIIRRLDSSYRRALVIRALQRMVVQKRSFIQSLLVPIEMLLHVLWTHLIHYSSEQATSSAPENLRSPLGPGRSQTAQSQSHLKSSTLRFLSVPDAGSFRTEASVAICKVTEKLEKIQLNEDFAGRGWRANQSYLELMCRCLQEVVSIDERTQSNEAE